jgi:hypothetical protein
LGELDVTDDPAQLAARARWCRRLARDCLDDTTRSSLKDMAAELEDRAKHSDDQA